MVWIATAATLVLACWPGLAELWTTGQLARYSALTALNALTALAVIWYTYFTQRTLEHSRASAQEAADQQTKDDDRRRSSTCTAVLWEVRSLLPRLRRMRKGGPSMHTPDFFSHPMLRLAASNPSLMRNIGTISSLAETSRRLADLQEFLRRYVELNSPLKPSNISLDGHKRALEEGAEIGERLKFQAAWAHNAAAGLVPFLETEGGLRPSGAREEPVAELEQIPLMPDPFEMASE